MFQGIEQEIRVHPLIAGRWSPYGFAGRPVAEADLRALFEAARHAPSSMNEQPWRFLVARCEDGPAFETMLSCLVEGNRAWAKFAPVLALTAAKSTFTRNGKPNRSALHDLGLAAANLTFEAEARGLKVHQMGGILPERIREIYGVPEGWEVATALAVGYPGSNEMLPEHLRERDSLRKPRKALAEIVFAGRWEKPVEWAAS